MELVKRKYCYVQKPHEHDIECPECKGSNLDWSEWEKHIWCYDCKKDINNYVNALSGPIPIRTAAMIGISLDMINLETMKLRSYNMNTNKYEED